MSNIYSNEVSLDIALEMINNENKINNITDYKIISLGNNIGFRGNNKKITDKLEKNNICSLLGYHEQLVLANNYHSTVNLIGNRNQYGKIFHDNNSNLGDYVSFLRKNLETSILDSVKFKKKEYKFLISNSLLKDSNMVCYTTDMELIKNLNQIDEFSKDYFLNVVGGNTSFFYRFTDHISFLSPLKNNEKRIKEYSRSGFNLTHYTFDKDKKYSLIEKKLFYKSIKKNKFLVDFGSINKLPWQYNKIKEESYMLEFGFLEKQNEYFNLGWLYFSFDGFFNNKKQK